MNLEALGLNVSRETRRALNVYQAEVEKWNSTINLVSKKSISDLWLRHILDSAQILSYVEPAPGLWLDLGSGGGFPGAVCAIIAKEQHPTVNFELVDSDARKCEFLRTASRVTGHKFSVSHSRIEELTPRKAATISARALSSLKNLFELVEPHVSRETICVFPKGESVDDEIAEALDFWQFEAQKHPSRTHENGVILEISELERAG